MDRFFAYLEATSVSCFYEESKIIHEIFQPHANNYRMNIKIPSQVREKARRSRN